jgi:hypothetical protein
MAPRGAQLLDTPATTLPYFCKWTDGLPGRWAWSAAAVGCLQGTSRFPSRNRSPAPTRPMVFGVEHGASLILLLLPGVPLRSQSPLQVCFSSRVPRCSARPLLPGAPSRLQVPEVCYFASHNSAPSTDDSKRRHAQTGVVRPVSGPQSQLSLTRLAPALDDKPFSRGTHNTGDLGYWILCSKIR